MPSAIVELVRKDIDVNEHDKSSNLILKQIKEKLQTLYCRSAFHSHSRVFNNDHNSYPKMSVKWHLAIYSLSVCSWFTSLRFLLVSCCSIFSWCLHRFVDHYLSFCPFSFGQFIVFHLTASDFLLGIFKLFFRNNNWWSHQIAT